MDSIAILIPTIGRSERLEKVADNIHKNTTAPHTIYFLIEQSDQESRYAVENIGEKYLFNKGTQYVGAINTGYKMTTEPFIMCASDDLDFKKGWDTECLKVMEDKNIGITGPVDSWPISKTKKHISHLFIRRSYIQGQSGVEDEANTIYSNKYYHLMCDIETEQTAMKRGAFKIAEKAVVEHNHWVIGTADKDETYGLASKCWDHDKEVFDQRRKNFEQYLFEDLSDGKVTPINRGKLTCVMLSYNCLKYTAEAIEVLKVNTYNDFEFVIVDDLSDDPTRNYLKQLNLGDRIKIKRVLQDEHHYFTANINTGFKNATGDFIAFLNNDIRMSKNWDIYLMNALEQKNVYIANPFQQDAGSTDEKYGKHERAGGIDIRGTCFMMKRENIEKVKYDETHFLPPQLIFWTSDSWLAYQVTKVFKKKSVFIPEAVVFHWGSKSTTEMDERNLPFWWIVRGDVMTYQLMTGIDSTHLLKIALSHLKFTY